MSNRVKVKKRNQVVGEIRPRACDPGKSKARSTGKAILWIAFSFGFALLVAFGASKL